MKDTTLGYIGKSILVALVTYVGLNGAAFMMLFGDSLQPWQMPYSENFDQLDRLDYRQFGGNWKLQDGALVQTNGDMADLIAVIPLPLDAEQSYRFQARVNFRSSNQGGGLMFNMQHANDRKESQMVRFGADQNQTYLVYGSFDAVANFTGQGGGPIDVSAFPDGSTLAVEVGSSSYKVIVNDQVIAADVPLQYKGGHVALTTWFSQIAFDDVSLTALEAPVQAATAVPQTEATTASPAAVTEPLVSVRFDGATDTSRWQPFSGEWVFEPEALVQTNATTYDNSITYLEKFNQYAITAQFSHREGMGGGVLFNMPQPDSQRGAHMVRYFPEDMLVWGYFDDNGVFQGQGSAPVAVPGKESHRLRVSANGTGYDIQLDGQSIATNVPLMSKEGYVGLTASTSVAAFEQLDIEASNALMATNPAQVQTGDWSSTNNTVTQGRTDVANYSKSIGVYGETFTVSVDVTLPEAAAEAVSGGLIFRATDTTDLSGAYAVRLGANQQVVWGTIDDQYQFQAQGSAPANLTGGTHNLALRVNATAYEILLDGQPVATDLPLPSSAGWLHFDAVGGPVIFSNFNMSLTGG